MLFRAIEDALDAMDRQQVISAIQILQHALEQAEEAHLDADILPEQ
jgi:hypothetical protein